MSIFDKFKDKASELVQGAGDKVSEATGIDLSGVTDQVTQSTEGLTETAQGHAEEAQGFADGAGDQVTEATGIDVPTEGVTDQATDKFGDITGR